MKVAIDTNILVYIEGVNPDGRRAVAVAVLDELRRSSAAVIPVQAVAEL